jgi:hypothetical protein
MKKIVNLFLILLMMSVFFLPGCTEEDSSDDQGYMPPGDLHDVDISDWTPVYLPVDDSTPLNLAIDRFHLHVNEGGVAIQKVFVNSTKSTASAIYVLDFTQDSSTVKPGFPYFMDGAGYDYFFPDSTNSHVKEGGTANGRVEFSSDGGYVYGGNWGSPTAYNNQTTRYWGFIIKKVNPDTELGDVRFELRAGSERIFADNGKSGKTLRLYDALEPGD